MRESLNAELDRWTREGLIEPRQVDRIRAFEAARVNRHPPLGRRRRDSLGCCSTMSRSSR